MPLTVSIFVTKNYIQYSTYLSVSVISTVVINMHESSKAIEHLAQSEAFLLLLYLAAQLPPP